MRGSMVDGKCSSSPAASSNEVWMRARNSGVSCAPGFLEKSRRQFNSKPFWISRKERKERKEKPPRFARMRHDPPSCHHPFFASLCALCALCAKQFEAFLDFAQRAQRTQRKTSEVRRDAPRSTIMPRSLLRLPLRPLRSLRETIRSLPGFRAKSAKNAKKNLRGSPGCATIHHHATIPSSPPFAPFALFAPNNLCPRQENRQADFLVVGGTVALGVVHGGYFHAARSQFGIGNPDHAVTAVSDRRHQTALAFGDGVQCHPGEGGGHHAVHEIGASGAQIVGQVADDGFFPGGALDLVAQVLGHGH